MDSWASHKPKRFLQEEGGVAGPDSDFYLASINPGLMLLEPGAPEHSQDVAETRHESSMRRHPVPSCLN